jgi:hypothetical protein
MTYDQSRSSIGDKAGQESSLSDERRDIFLIILAFFSTIQHRSRGGAWGNGRLKICCPLEKINK